MRQNAAYFVMNSNGYRQVDAPGSAFRLEFRPSRGQSAGTSQPFSAPKKPRPPRRTKEVGEERNIGFHSFALISVTDPGPGDWIN
jgi:hypothetical protein